MISRILPYLLAGAVTVAGCSSDPKPVSKQWPIMGTYASISVPAAEHAGLYKCVAVAKDTFDEIDKQYSQFKPSSDISRINKVAGQLPARVSPDTCKLLETCMSYAHLSRGCFDPTVSPLVRLWGFNGGQVPATQPSEESLAQTMKLVGWQQMVVSDKTAFLPLLNMKLDLGGIAKGYAVDQCYNKFRVMRVTNAMINLGGNIKCIGMAKSNGPWRIGIRNPFQTEQLVGTLSLQDGMAVATSGNYERFVTIEGTRYAHIIDPRNGRPVKGMAGVTVISASATEADAMSTALFVLGLEESTQVLRKLTSCNALFIPDQQPVTIWISPGFEEHFTPTRQFRASIHKLW